MVLFGGLANGDDMDFVRGSWGILKPSLSESIPEEVALEEGVGRRTVKETLDDMYKS